VSQKNLGFLYGYYIVKNRGFPPVYKIERVEKMSAKRAFFSVFQKIMVVCCAIFFGFANAFSANLPSGYTELEYIESTGTQWIDTGVNIGENIQTKVKFGKTTNSFTKFGYVIGGGGHYQGLVTRTIENSYYMSMYNSSQNTVTITMPDDVFEVTFNTPEHKVIINNADSFDLVLMSPYEINTTIGVFNTPGASSNIGIGKVYSFVIKDNSSNSIVRNLIPAKNSSGVVGMYDTVGNRFYTNQGTGTFTAGPVVGIRIATTTYNNAQFNPVVTDLNTTIATIRDVVTNTINQTKAIADLQAKKQTRPDEQCPAGKKCLLVEDNNGVPHWYEIIENIYGLPTGYTPLEYIESTGTQYINTGVDINSGNFSIDTDMQFTALTSPQYYGIYGGGYFGITDSYFAIGGHGTSVTANKTKHNFVLSSSIGDNKVLTLSIDGTNYTYTRNVIAGRIALLTVLNGSTTMGLVRAKMYSVKIYQNGTLVRNMVPAKNSSGVIGMYDLVNDVFYTNSGTGTFTAGPEI
jgi:hypothetical protein